MATSMRVNFEEPDAHRNRQDSGIVEPVLAFAFAALLMAAVLSMFGS
jgi:hypothetical protein